MKKYFIREVGTVYNDEFYNAVQGFGGIIDSFDNLEEATKALRKLTHHTLKGYSPIRMNALYYSGSDVIKKLDAYVNTNFGDEILCTSPRDGKIEVDDYYAFPRHITEEQAWEIREITGLPLLQIYEVKENISPFWGFRQGKGMRNPNEWISINAFRVDQNNRLTDRNKLPVFFLSEEEAFSYIRDMDISDHLDPNGLKGTYEELSDTPHILKSLVEKDRSIHYDEDRNRLVLSNSWNYENLITINSLLKEKFIKVMPIPVEEIEQFGKGWTPMQ